MMRQYLPVVSIILLALFSGLLAVVAAAPAMLAPLDAFAHALVAPLQTPAWSNAFLAVSNYGSTVGIVIGIVIVTFYFRHRPDIITRLYFAIVASTISNEYIKNLVARPRPPVLSWLQPIHSYSFPSGHSQASMVFYGFLALLLYVHTGDGPRGTVLTKVRKAFAVLAPTFFILIIGFSRIVLDAHYASDVLGGYLLGAFWLTFSLSLPLYYALYHQNIIHSEPIERPLL